MSTHPQIAAFQRQGRCWPEAGNWLGSVVDEGNNPTSAVEFRTMCAAIRMESEAIAYSRAVDFSIFLGKGLLFSYTRLTSCAIPMPTCGRMLTTVTDCTASTRIGNAMLRA